MASADLGKELECSVCLDFYTDPVTLKCGHNYCRHCIDDVLDSQKEYGSFSCPECREEFRERPALHRNITLRNIVENFLSVKTDQGNTGISCTYCIQTPVPAVKTCLLCEASLCDNHLRVHSKAPEHVLCDPTTSLEDRKCPVHKKFLEYYCIEDSSCICASCMLEEHQGHWLETLDESSEKKKQQMRIILQKMMSKREQMEKKVQVLHENRGKLQGKAVDETKRITALFRNLKKRLKGLEKKVLYEVSTQAEQISRSLSEVTRQLETKKDELCRNIGHLEELCSLTDPMTILQEEVNDYSEDGDDEDPERLDKLLRGGGGLDEAVISHMLNKGLSYIMSGLNIEKCPDSPVHPHSSMLDTVQKDEELPKPLPKPSPSPQRPQHKAGGPKTWAVQPMLGVSVVTDILLDVNTAGNRLHISDDRKTASWSDYKQNRPETPERFQDCPQVLASQGFTWGQHYWEVDVGGSGDWIIGMCYPSIDRMGGESVIGGNNKSWCVERWGWNNQYLAIHDKRKIQLPGNVSSSRVRVELDYEAGRISFYDLCGTLRHLHTFATTFTEPLHPVLFVGDGYVKICGGR